MDASPVEILLLIGLAALAVDLFVGATWNERLFRFGPIILRRIVPSPFDAGGVRTLERANEKKTWPPLKFNRFSTRVVGFREAIVRNPFTIPYVPLMRGEVVFDHRANAAYVVGRLNPFFILLTACLLGTLGIKSGDGAAVVMFLPVLLLNLWLQWCRFAHVATAITASGRTTKAEI